MSPIDTWNTLAQRWLDGALPAAWMSALTLALVSVVWLGLRRRASAHLGHALFLLPLLPLALPSIGTVELRLPASTPGIAWLAPQSAAPSITGDGAALERSDDASATRPDPSSPILVRPDPLPDVGASGDGAAARPTAAAWLVLAWAVIAGTLLTRFVAVQVRTHRLVRSAMALELREDRRVQAALERARRRNGLRRPVTLVTSDAIGSPAVWGVLRPVLVLPVDLAQRLDDRQLDWVLSHELAHLARHDLPVSALQRVVQIVWFFHPVVWLAGLTADQLRECACDEAALARVPVPARRRCAEALLEVAARRPASATPHLALQNLLDETILMKKRILRLIDPRRTARNGLTPAALPALLLLAGASLASVRVAQEPTPAPRVVQEPVEEVFEELGVSLEEALAARERATAWLLAQQREDGHWPTGPGTEADTGEFNVVGVTGLAVLALQEQQPAGGPAGAAAMSRALDWLASVQDAETGLFGPLRGHRVMASHAVATRAWLKARAGRAESAWRPQAERAVAAIVRAHNPYRGWRFSHLPDGDNDSFTTSLMLSTLAEAAAAGLEVPRATVEAGLSFLDEMTEPSNGRTGYNDRGSMAPRLAGKAQDFPAELSEMCTAIALVARLDWDQQPLHSKAIRDGAHLVASAAPDWDPARGSTDFYHWLFGTEALQRLGGYGFEHWREELLMALIPQQRPEGWWPAVDAWSDEGTTTHATVINLLALQAALR